MAGGGLSSDPEKRERQLANLVDAPPAPQGNTRNLQHGAFAEVSLAGPRAEILEALSAAAPVKDATGAVPLADAATLELAARAVARMRSIDDWLAEHGEIDDQGNVREAVRHADRVTKTAAGLLSKLGMNPRDRAALLGDAALAGTRGRDLAREWSGDDGGGGS
jgi:hypothetical protein